MNILRLSKLSIQLAALLGSIIALGQQPSMGPLASIIQPGPDGSWVVSSGPRGVELQNQQAAGDLTYYYVNEQPAQLGQRTIGVTLQLRDTGLSALGGLLYAFRDNPRSYYLFTAGGDGTVNLHFRGEGGFDRKLQTALRGVPGEPVMLKIVEMGSAVELWANGEKVGVVEEPGMGRGAVGIVAADIGNFRFSNFTITAGVSASNARPSAAMDQRTRQASFGPVKMHDHIDPNLGMVQRRVPLPAGWQLDKNPNDLVFLNGPNGIVAYQTDSGRFVDAADPFMRESARIGGANVGPVKSVSAYLHEDYVPYMQRAGYTLRDEFAMPDVQEFWERFGAAMPQGLSRKRYEVVGARWIGRDGSRAFSILVLNVLSRPNMATWNVAIGEVYASPEDFEHAEQTLSYVATRTEVNPKWQIAMNERLLDSIRADKRIADETMRQSQVAHLQRMNSILARGEASRQTAKINSDILDSSHASYLRRSDMVTSGNQKFTEMIHEQSVIGNSNTGEMYQVDAGYKHHWVSSNGVHLATDNTLYDPRTDQLLNQTDWSSFEVVR